MLGIAIVGAGAIAGVHMDAYREFGEDCRIRAVCDIYEDKAQGLLENRGIEGAKAYKNLEEAVSDLGTGDGGINVVSICLPPSLHCAETVKALRNGCHVLVEKPMACSLEECDQMIEAAQENGKVLSVVCQNRFKTPMQRIHQMIEDGTGGRVTHAIVNSLWWRGENYYDLWWRGTWESESGGCFTSHSVHHIDLLQWMMGMPDSVMACMKNVGHHNSELEDVGVAILNYPEALAQITTSIVDHGEEQEMIFQTEKGRLSIPWNPAASRPLPNGFPEEDKEAFDELEQAYHAIPEMAREGHAAQIENFFQAIKGKEELLTGGQEGRKAIELIAAIYKSSVTRCPVDLPLSKEDAFYRKSTMVPMMPHFFEKTKSVENFEKAEITLGRDVGK